MLFADERPVVSLVQFDPTTQPIGSGLQGVPEGTMWYDASLKLMRIMGPSQQPFNMYQTIITNATPVTATNPSAAANLMNSVIPAGFLNAAGKTVYIWGAGTYTTAAGQTPTFTLTLLLGATTLLTFASAATTASVTKTWNFEAFITTVTTGVSGTLEAHGIFNVELGAGAAGSVAESSTNDAIVAVSAATDLTLAETLQIKCLFSSSNAGNSIVERQQLVQVTA